MISPPIPQTASQILTLSADTLTEEEWTQCALFYVGQNEQKPAKVPCRCAHGQVQWCGQGEDFRENILDLFNHSSVGNLLEMDHSEYMSLVAAHNAGYQSSKGSPLDPFPSTPLLWAHYYLAKVGCTFRFNDQPERTHAEVVAKLREAAILAFSEGR